ncbi:hypothetical protein E2C01_077597 [Portunus trituberculatus]|uniref:Uncharacterized protein n=1 Tax=Portunus trituberculatus TaxID=210409 RepID=A0A5B7IQ42_PORTR|nr:hypothetical protein [Portunus trituberculatus]
MKKFAKLGTFREAATQHVWPHSPCTVLPPPSTARSPSSSCFSPRPPTPASPTPASLSSTHHATLSQTPLSLNAQPPCFVIEHLTLPGERGLGEARRVKLDGGRGIFPRIFCRAAGAWRHPPGRPTPTPAAAGDGGSELHDVQFS